MNNLSEALELADHNFSIIPIKSNEKHPAIDSWKPYQLERASKETINRWFANDDSNIGVVTGKVSNVVVLDIDNVAGIKPEHVLPDTPTVKTNRGYHYYFKHPGFDFSSFKIPGLGEVQSDGKYVVAPPSIHPSGAKYEWLVELGEVPLADMPDWLLSKARSYTTPKASLHSPANDNETTSYGKAWFADVEELAREASGGRNDLLNKVACKAGSLIGAGQLNQREAISAMLEASKANGLVKDDGYGQTMNTIRSGIEAGKKNPRAIDNPTIQAEPVLPGKFTYKRASEYKAEIVPWLWEPVLIKGAITFLAGDGGLGKSTIALDIAARISNGDKHPSGNGTFEKGNVIYLTSEDDPNYTIIPRLNACGANCDHIIIPETVRDEKGERQFELKRDVQAIEEIVKDVGNVPLVIIDPFNAYLGSSELNDMGQMRGVLTPYSELARKHRLCLMFIHHFNKGTGKASSRMAGSGALRAAARTVYHIDRDPSVEDRRIIVSDKNNLGNDRTAFACNIKLREMKDGTAATYLEWEKEAFNKSSDDVMLESRDGPAIKVAKDLLRAILEQGPVSYSDIWDEAQKCGIKRTTLSDAKEALGVVVATDEKDRRKTVWKIESQPF